MVLPVILPTLFGLCFLAAGLITYRQDFRTAGADRAFGLVAFGPAFVAAALAAFAGEHFSAATTLAPLVPKWLPAPLLITYFVGLAHFSAASSYAARRYVRWSTIGLAVMFGLFVLLMDLPAAIARPTATLRWILAARQATFAIGALALFSIETRSQLPKSSDRLAMLARFWTACVLVFYGIQHVIHPEYTPGVPSTELTAAWVPFPILLSYATGLLLIVFGIAMFVRRYASAAAALAALLMLLLTVVLYVPQFVIASGAVQRIVAINFIFDTLLFAGTVFVISKAISSADSEEIAAPRVPA